MIQSPIVIFFYLNRKQKFCCFFASSGLPGAGYCTSNNSLENHKNHEWF
jgi:hypothetical protein